MGRQTVEEYREDGDRWMLRLRGMVRRVVVGLTEVAGGAWQALGYKDSDGNQETFNNVEMFGGVGIHARPADNGRVEAIIIHVGGDEEHPVMVATRDRSMQVELQADETAIFNSQTVIRVKADGTVEIGSRGATLTPLDEIVHGRGVDTFTGLTYKALGSTTSKLKAEK